MAVANDDREPLRSEGAAKPYREAEPVPRHIVVLLHGIRTRAFWYDQARPLLNSIENVEVKPLGYGYFNVLRFLFPFFTRRGPARKIANEIRKIKWFYAQRKEEIRISVIAHSFGTYTIVSILEHEHDIDLHNLVLCGSVLPVDFDFGEIVRKVNNRLINDVGARDVWPVIAKIASFGYGESGTYGFTSALCEDRFHDFTHSDFFTIDFIKDFWCPLFARNEVVPSKYMRTLESQSRGLGLASSLPRGTLPIAALAGLFLSATVFGSSVYSSVCDRWRNAPGCAVSEVVPRAAVISHLMGEPVVQLAIRADNRTQQPAEVAGLKLTATSPRGMAHQLTLGGLSQSETGGLLPPANLSVPAGIAQEYFLWWSPRAWNLLGAEVTRRVRQLPEYASKWPCYNNEPLSSAAMEVVRAFFDSNFIWMPGVWTLSLEATLAGKKLHRDVKVTFSDQDIEDMRKVVGRYQQCYAINTSTFLAEDGEVKTFVRARFD